MNRAARSIWCSLRCVSVSQTLTCQAQPSLTRARSTMPSRSCRTFWETDTGPPSALATTALHWMTPHGAPGWSSRYIPSNSRPRDPRSTERGTRSSTAGNQAWSCPRRQTRGEERPLGDDRDRPGGASHQTRNRCLYQAHHVPLPVSWTREGDTNIAPRPSIVDPDVTEGSHFIRHAAIAATRAATGV